MLYNSLLINIAVNTYAAHHLATKVRVTNSNTPTTNSDIKLGRIYTNMS